MQVPRAAPSEVISTFSSGWWDLNLHPASWPFLQGRRDLGRGCHWPLWKLLPLPGQPECLRRDPASCFQLASCEQWGLCHSSLMKLSIETRATWKAHGAQALVVLCHGIHQFKSNSRILNTWIRISLAKCFSQRLLAKKGWVGLWTAGQTVMTTNPKWRKTCHQPRLVASLSEAGLKLHWEESLSPSWFHQSPGWHATLMQLPPAMPSFHPCFSTSTEV